MIWVTVPSGATLLTMHSAVALAFIDDSEHQKLKVIEPLMVTDDDTGGVSQPQHGSVVVSPAVIGPVIVPVEMTCVNEVAPAPAVKAMRLLFPTSALVPE